MNCKNCHTDKFVVVSAHCQICDNEWFVDEEQDIRIAALEAENAALKADLAFDRQKVEETLPQLDAIKFMVDTLKAENAALKEDKEQATDALQKICAWAEAYPLEFFPEPDFKLVRKALEAYGIAIDCVSASNMRHVITQVAQIAIEGLISRRELYAPPESEE